MALQPGGGFLDQTRTGLDRAWLVLVDAALEDETGQGAGKRQLDRRERFGATRGKRIEFEKKSRQLARTRRRTQRQSGKRGDQFGGDFRRERRVQATRAVPEQHFHAMPGGIDRFGKTMFNAGRNDDEVSGGKHFGRMIAKLVGKLSFDAKQQLDFRMVMPIRAGGG